MKFDPNLYIQVNHKQRLDTKDVIGKYSSNFDWRSDGTDSLLDVGCGCADVTVDFILPILPEKFDRSVGIDTSKDMIDYARSKYSYQGLTFEQFDLELNLEDQPLYGIEPFDHITSFYCLHWIRNQEKVMKTFSKLLKPSGDALLTFVATHPQFEIIKRMSKSTKWAQYTDDVNRFIPIYHKLAKPDMELERVLRLSGFTDIKIDILDKSYLYEGTEYTTSKELRVKINSILIQAILTLIFFRIFQIHKSVYR